jgi:hypothetical protein
MTGFWHIGKGSKGEQSDLVKLQLQEIMGSPLFNSEVYEVKIRYLSRVQLTPEVESLLQTTERFGKIDAPTGVCATAECYEMPTLSALHSFCQEESSSAHYVFYIHTKSDTQWRTHMQVHLSQRSQAP